MTTKHIVVSGFTAVILAGLLAEAYWSAPAPQVGKISAAAPVATIGNKTSIADSSAGVANSSSQAGASVPVAHVVRIGAVSFTTTSQPHVSIVGGQKVAYPGLFCEERITVGGKTYDSTPNQVGAFQRIYIEAKAKAKVAIQVGYPDGQAGDPVAVEVEDGGELGNKTMGSVVKLDDQKTAQFQFLAGDQAGIYRLVLRNGADVKTINLWVGQDTASN